MFVSTRPPLNLCAAWVALEDVSADSGPLKYMPGSHRLPWFEFSPGEIACGQDMPRDKFVDFGIWLQHQMKERGLEWREFTGERGDGTLTRYGLEEYVADCVILLDNRVEEQLSTRRLRLVK